MAQDGGSGDHLAAPNGDSPASKSLKKKKSLTRLFSSSKKPSRSRPPSSEDLRSSPTAPTPTLSWPLISESSPRIPSMRFGSFMNHEKETEGSDSNIQEKDRLSSATATPSNKQARIIVDNKPAVRNFSEPAGRGSPVLSGDGMPETASAVRIRQVQMPKIHHAPTFPTSSKPSTTGLRMPSGSSSGSRGRGTSVVVPSPKLKSSLVQPQLSRPSTAGPESLVKPTGKRRPSTRAAALDGAFPFSSYDDLSKVPQRPWQAQYSSDEVRSSFRSALTTKSSHGGTTDSERTSIATKSTSFTELTVDAHSRPTSKAASMTVDDAIDMYAAGFTDDDDSAVRESRETSISEEERRRSIRIAEAINESMGDLVLPSPSSTGESTSSQAIMSGEALSNKSSLPPSLVLPTSTRDQYGFLKSNHHITLQQYDVWSAMYLPDQERRTRKWTTYMRDHGLSTSCPTRFPGRSTKTQRFIRKGIPPAWRGPAWFFYAGGDAYLKQHAGLYDYLVTRSEAKLPETDREAIERDINRTFPDNIHFKPDHNPPPSSVAEPPILTSLRRVLRAFAFHSPRIGYCQSLNFLTGLLLLFLPEEKAFWMLHIITTVNLPGTHEVSLEGANVDLWVLMVALKSSMPGIWSKVGAAGTPGDGLDNSARLPPISLCTTSWFMSLFIGTLPIESVLRVWDVLFYEGSRTLFRVALTIFKFGEQRIKNVGDSMELFQVIQSLPRGMLDAGTLINAVCRRGAVGAEWIEARRWERREWYSRERARALVPVDEGVRNEYFAQRGDGVAVGGGQQKSDTEGLKRRESLWKRRKRKGSAPEQQQQQKSSPQQEDGDSAVSSPSEALSPGGRDPLALFHRP